MEKRKTDLVVTAYIFDDKKRLLLIHHNKLDMWLPVGGHIEPNETPDEAILREIQEETGLKVEIQNIPEFIPEGNVKAHLATPFHVNVHSVGDHDHCSLFYICKTKNPEEIKIQKEEIKGFRWVSQDELQDDSIKKEISDLAKKAHDITFKH
jgi:8-oxo-dGTP diphosphatase